MLKDVSREEAGRIARLGQAGAAALVLLAVAVVVFGARALRPADAGAPQIAEAPKVENTLPEGDLPAVLTKRAESISKNLAMLGNAPKPPPPPPPVEIDPEAAAGATEIAPPPPAADTAIAYLGMFGSGANPMALVSIDARQQVVSSGQTIKHNGEDIKIGKIERDKIEIERRSATKTVDLAPRTTTSYTALSGASPPPTPNSIMPPQSPNRRGSVVETMRAPGSAPSGGPGRPRPVPHDGVPMPNGVSDEGVPQR